MNIKNPCCSWCNTEFELTEKQITDVSTRISERGTGAMVRIYCPHCKDVTIFHIHIEDDSIDLIYEQEEIDDRLFCCPVSACIGFVEEDKDEKVFGCSECGTEWTNLNEVYQDIEKIIADYPYRIKVYKKTKTQYKSIAFDKIPKDYYKKVNTEKI